MSQNFQAGDYLIFQVESGYGLLRLFGIDTIDGEKVWYLSAFNEMFLDVESADATLLNSSVLSVNIPFVALTNRAFEATQTARMLNVPLNDDEQKAFEELKLSSNQISDISIRLLLGLR